MNVEHCTKVFPLDENLDANLKQANAEGWLGLPGMVPIAIFSMVRIKQDNPNAPSPAPSAGATARVHIDDSKVSIYRDGKPVDETQT